MELLEVSTKFWTGNMAAVRLNWAANRGGQVKLTLLYSMTTNPPGSSSTWWQSGRQHIIFAGFTSYSWPALTNWEDNVKKTLHRRNLGCTSTFLTLSVMLRSRRLTSGEIVQVLHVSSGLSSCKWSQRCSIWRRWEKGVGILGVVRGNGYDF